MKDTVKIEKECHLGFVSDSSMTVEYKSILCEQLRKNCCL